MLPTTLISAALVTAMAVPSPVVSVLAQPEPDPSWGEDTSEEAAPEATPAEDAAPEDASTETEGPADPHAPTNGVQPAAAVAATTTPIAPKTVDDIVVPEQKGLGLMITAGALGAVGWGVMGLRIARIHEKCQADAVDVMSVSEDDLEMVTESARDCFINGKGANMGFWFLQAVPNAINWGIAPGAATVRAKYDAARSAKTGEVNRKPGVFIGTGAGLLGVGVVGRIVVMVMQVRSLNPLKGVAAGCIDGAETQVDEFFDCYASGVSLRYGMHQLTSAAVAGGAGLLAYGVVYKRERKNYEKNFGAAPVAKLEFRVQPELSLNYTGVSANLRF